MSAARTTGSTGITDEAVTRLRARIGIAEPHPQPPHYLHPNEDAFRRCGGTAITPRPRGGVA